MERDPFSSVLDSSRGSFPRHSPKEFVKIDRPRSAPLAAPWRFRTAPDSVEKPGRLLARKHPSQIARPNPRRTFGIKLAALGERGVRIDSVERRAQAGMHHRRPSDDRNLDPIGLAIAQPPKGHHLSHLLRDTLPQWALAREGMT